MVQSPHRAAEPEARPLLLISLTVLFVAGLLIVAGATGDQEERNAEWATAREKGRPTGSGAGAFMPGAPVSGYEGGSPLPDGGPAVTIIQDVRETMHRLPLDRNNPEKYDPVSRPRTETPERSRPIPAVRPRAKPR